MAAALPVQRHPRSLFPEFSELVSEAKPAEKHVRVQSAS